MAVRKIAISVPEDVLKQVDRLAKRTGTTRSGLITRVLTHLSLASTQREITEQIDRLFKDPDLLYEQVETSRAFLHSPRKRYGDSKW